MTIQTLELRVIPAAELDLAATVDVVNAAFRRHAILSEGRTSLEDIAEELWPDCRFLQVFDGDRLVGTASITPGVSAPADPEEFPGIDIPRSLYFGMAAVSPARMGGGIGARLLAEAERIAREEGFERVILTTLEEMGNVVYYERFGYHTLFVRALPAGHWGLTIPTHEHGMAKELSGFGIREGRPEEAAEIATLVNLAYEVERFFTVGDRTDEPEVAHLLEKHTFLVTDGADGRLAGCVLVEVNGERGYFGMLSVHPAVQGTGLGRRLVEAAERYCAERGCSDLELWVVNLREELPPWYERLGYRVTGTEPWPPDEVAARLSRDAHFLKMSKPLTDPQARTGVPTRDW